MRWKKLVPWLAVLLIAIVAPACSDNDVDGRDDADSVLFASDAFALAGIEDMFDQMQDATEFRDFTMGPVLNGDGRFHHPGRRHDRPGNHLGLPLRLLGLSRDQQEAIRDAIRDYQMEVREQMEGMRAANQSIVDAANAERDEIFRALEAGEITPGEAMERLRDLNERTHQAIRDNPANEPYRQAICAAREALYDEIRSILDPTQQLDWDSWVASHPGCD